ncbi:hypothetical protein BBP40_005135 [Aspergillus hancockii]|nr:hypothetical protein BBP40_005135 [Aspergillus hancockii]
MNGAMLLYDVNNSTAERLLAPMRGFLDASNATAISSLTPAATLPWYELVKMVPAIENVGTMQSARTSRFIPRRAVEENLELFAKTLEKITADQVPSIDGVSAPSISGTMTGSRNPR